MHFLSRFGDSSLKGDKLSSGQAQNEVKFDFQVKFYLEFKVDHPPK